MSLVSVLVCGTWFFPIEEQLYSTIVQYVASLLKEKSGTFNKAPLPAIPKLLQVGGDSGVKLGALGLLLAQRRGEPVHFLLERLSVVLLRLGTDVAARREHVTVFADLFECCALAEARHVAIPGLATLQRGRWGRAGARRSQDLAAPGVVGVGYAGDVVVRQLAVGTIHHTAHLARVEEEHVAAAVTEFAVLLVARQKPEARRNLRRVEELTRQRHHAVHDVGFNHALADLTLARLV